MNAVEGEPAKVVAVLHDVIEDTSVTAEDLRREGFDEAVLAAVECLTHRKGEPYADYVVRSPSPLHPSQVGPSSPGYTDDGLLEPGVPCRPVATRRCRRRVVRAAATALVLSARLSNSITSRKAVMVAMLSDL